MTVRVTITGTALRAKLAVMGFGVLAILACVAAAGCSHAAVTSAISSATHYPATQTTSPPNSTTSPPASSTATATATATAKPTATVTVTVTATPAVTVTTAPQTGGGGTAGLQDTMLFGLGGAAILTGAAGIAYRRRLSRGR